MFNRLKIILIHTTHPGNIGAVARAMKNMGLSRLCLVEPKDFPSPEAVYRACGAQDLLEQACVVPTLDIALQGCRLAFGFSARARKIEWPTFDVRPAALRILEELNSTASQDIALVFGREDSGLLNEELEKCQYQVLIPANPAYSSLNLAQAVQIASYELRMALLFKNTIIETGLCEKVEITSEIAATLEEMEGFYHHLESVLIQIQALDPKLPGYLMSRLRRLYSKAKPDKTELNILRGILTSIERKNKKEYSLTHD